MKGGEPSGLSRRFMLGANLGSLVSASSFAGLVQLSVEAGHATIEPLGDGRLNVQLAAGERRVLVFTPARGVWDWSSTSKLVIPVDNRGDARLTLTIDEPVGEFGLNMLCDFHQMMRSKGRAAGRSRSARA